MLLNSYSLQSTSSQSRSSSANNNPSNQPKKRSSSSFIKKLSFRLRSNSQSSENRKLNSSCSNINRDPNQYFNKNYSATDKYSQIRPRSSTVGTQTPETLAKSYSRNNKEMFNDSSSESINNTTHSTNNGTETNTVLDLEGELLFLGLLIGLKKIFQNVKIFK